jgi:hypothetical protein
MVKFKFLLQKDMEIIAASEDNRDSDLWRVTGDNTINLEGPVSYKAKYQNTFLGGMVTILNNKTKKRSPH